MGILANSVLHLCAENKLFDNQTCVTQEKESVTMMLMMAEVNSRRYVILLNGGGEGLAIDCGWAVCSEQSGQTESCSGNSGATAKILGRELGETELLELFRSKLLGLNDALAERQARILPEVVQRVKHLYVVSRNEDGSDDHAASLGIVFPLAEVEEAGDYDFKEVPEKLSDYPKTFARRHGIDEAMMRRIAGPFGIYVFDGRNELLISYDPEGGREFNLLLTEDPGFGYAQALTNVSPSMDEAPDRIHHLSPGNYLFIMAPSE